MITDNQVKKLKRELQHDARLETAAAQAGMDPKTARKYRALDTLPSEIKAARVDAVWCVRGDITNGALGPVVRVRAASTFAHSGLCTAAARCPPGLRSP
jgi:hypothetical protein